ncbi:hypothetical protein QQZ08_003015 [Neonectria magnoliae]|uniref:Uncharacterized protein n=1 Tax=Neonectria magnoliae TaxID=2732573 RepID=A0ABR1IAD4_9HYPO
MQVWFAEIDPDGDTLIILPHPPNACLFDEADDAPAEDDVLSEEEPLAEDDAPAEQEPLAEDDAPAEDFPPAEEIPPPDDVPRLEHPRPLEATEEYPDYETHFKVSMKHLASASRRAKAMFTGNYVESRKQADGLRRWKFEPLFDPAAFKIVMDAIHGHTHKLPKAVSMNRLAAIAVIVDDLDCQNALFFFADIWIPVLSRGSNPTTPCDDLARWILISFVFNRPDFFQHATRVAILEAKGPFSPAGLPIRPKIIETIDAEREGFLEVLTTQLRSLMQSISDNVTCKIECRSNMVGTLVHEMMSSKIFIPRPCRPFEGLSLAAVTGMLRNFQLPGLYCVSGELEGVPNGSWIVYREDIEMSMRRSKKKKKKSSMLYIDSMKHNCDLQDLVDSEIANLKTGVEGLKLSMFV